MSLESLAVAMHGDLKLGTTCDPSQLVNDVSTDSRAVAFGNVYVALRGDRFDGHAFLAAARDRGAIGAVIDASYLQSLAPSAPPPDDFALIVVADTLTAYQDLAAWHRRQQPDLAVVGITGSNGKTTTKDLVASVLSEGFAVLKTEGNFNNHIGVPRTLLRLNATHEIGVIELGINHPGEMAPLVRIAQPTAGIVTNIGTAHLEFMGSKATTAAEKGILVAELPADGFAILDTADQFSDSIGGRARCPVLKVGTGAQALRAENVAQHDRGMEFTVCEPSQDYQGVRLPVVGMHSVTNALFAFAIGRAFNLSAADCVAGLANVRMTSGRVEVKTVKGVRFLDDSYNANPESMVASLDTLARLSVGTAGKRMAVLGAMGELGESAAEGYRRVATAAGRTRLDILLTIGPIAGQMDAPARAGGVETVMNFLMPEEAATFLRDHASTADVVLVKGSRSARMERIVELFGRPDRTAANNS